MDCILDILVMDLDSSKYRKDPAIVVLVKQEWQKKTKYLEHFLDIKNDFMPLLYSVYEMVGDGVMLKVKTLAFLLAKKGHQEYSEMVEFVRLWMSLAVVGSNNFLLK